MKRRCVALVQARMGSSRLPGKVLLPAPDGRPLLALLLERLRRCVLVDTLCLATTDLAEDAPLARLAHAQGVQCVRGSAHDVLHRLATAAVALHAYYVVRITADCPLLDPQTVDRVAHALVHSEPPAPDYVDCGPEFPEGLQCEGFRASWLRYAAHHARLPSDREHVIPYLRRHPRVRRCSLSYDGSGEDRAHPRLTVDTAEDYAVVRAVLRRLGPHASLEHILDLYRDAPELWQANADLPRNAAYKTQIEAEAARPMPLYGVQ